MHPNISCNYCMCAHEYVHVAVCLIDSSVYLKGALIFKDCTLTVLILTKTTSSLDITKGQQVS